MSDRNFTDREIKAIANRILRGERATLVVSPEREAEARERLAALPEQLRKRLTLVVKT